MTKACMKTIHVHEAVGSVLCHDITRIVPGESKGPVFRKGHVVRPEDIKVLLEVGKEHLYVFEPLPGMVHENDAAARIVAATAGSNLIAGNPKEGRINLSAACDGLLKIDVPTLARINGLGEITVATMHSLQFVNKGRPVAGMRVVPLMIEEEKLRSMEEMVSHPVVEVLPLAHAKVGVVTTGSEVYYGRIQDAFGPVLRKKFAKLGSSIMGQTLTSDEVDMTAAAIVDFLHQGADMIVVTGGMSVDPDDRTPTAIRASGAEIVSYGAPVYPGAMFL
ncbi:MAG: molybdopterin-binding protein, partial [Desulfovibrio sp.]|uniref:molybdopterin-binding protein n=1 Tax=Desulfovibrio sp. TaxID=885 RepID=UPI0039E41036